MCVIFNYFENTYTHLCDLISMDSSTKSCNHYILHLMVRKVVLSVEILIYNMYRRISEI